MEREYDVTVCSNECATCQFSDEYEIGLDGVQPVWWIIDEELGSGYVDDAIGLVRCGEVGYCPRCGTHLGIDDDGRPWRKQMVPKAALEWLADHRNLRGCPAEWHISPVPCSGDGICPYERVERETRCWSDTALLITGKRTALAAAEEGEDDE